jgi:uncharacterized protein
MIGRVLERGEDAVDRVRSDTAQGLAHRRIKRVRWFKEWLEAEVAEMDVGSEESEE